MKKAALFLLALVVAVLVALVVWRETAQPRAPIAAKPLTLDVQSARVMTLPLYLQAVGQAVSVHSVAIRPQVSGMLEKVAFREGADIRRGQLLFQIDAAPFKATLLGAKATWEAARSNQQRMQTLLKKYFVTAQEYQQASADAEQAQAAFQTAKINLGYTDIRSPIAGRAGLLSVKSGNLVTSSDTALVTIKQMQPIDVQFALPQEQLDTIRHYFKNRHQGDAPNATQKGSQKAPVAADKQATGLKVIALNATASQPLASGKLVFLSNQVDTSTGTFTLKARFANDAEQLWPGQFVTARVVLEQQRVLVIPARALQTGQEGSYVYQIKAGKTQVTPVTLVREQAGLAIISAGLAAGDEVVTRVPRNLRVGMPATAQQPQTSSDSTATLPAASAASQATPSATPGTEPRPAAHATSESAAS